MTITSRLGSFKNEIFVLIVLIKNKSCPESCCTAITSLDEACCNSLGWVYALILALPFIAVIIATIVLLVLIKKRGLFDYNGRAIMYIDRFRPGSYFGRQTYPAPPPHYNEQNTSQSTNGPYSISIQTQTASIEPPSYISVLNSVTSPKVIIKNESRNNLNEVKPENLEVKFDLEEEKS